MPTNLGRSTAGSPSLAPRQVSSVDGTGERDRQGRLGIPVHLYRCVRERSWDSLPPIRERSAHPRALTRSVLRSPIWTEADYLRGHVGPSMRTERGFLPNGHALRSLCGTCAGRAHRHAKPMVSGSTPEYRTVAGRPLAGASGLVTLVGKPDVLPPTVH